MELKEIMQWLNLAIDRLNTQLYKMDIVTKHLTLNWDGLFCMDAPLVISVDWEEYATCFDYFTKELIIDIADWTEELIVIDEDGITHRHFKSWNQTKDVKTINGKFYIFPK